MARLGKIPKYPSPIDSHSFSSSASTADSILVSSSGETARKVSTAASSITLSQDVMDKTAGHHIDALDALEGKTSKPSRHSDRSRVSVPVSYNLSQLSGISRKQKSRRSLSDRAGQQILQGARQNVRDISGQTLVDEATDLLSPSSKKNEELLRDCIRSFDIDWDIDRRDVPALAEKMPAKTHRASFRTGARKIRQSITHVTSALGKRTREVVEDGVSELKDRRRSGRLLTIPHLKELKKEESSVDEDLEPARKKSRLSTLPARSRRSFLNLMSIQDTTHELSAAPPSNKLSDFRPNTRKYHAKGLYAGQSADFDPRLTDARNRAKLNNKNQAEAAPASRHNLFPLPMFASKARLDRVQDYILPFDVFSPLPPRQQRPEKYSKIQKNQFVGDAAAHWRNEHPDEQSYCNCKPEDGCLENCLNRLMWYECDAKNCRLQPDICKNHQFADLQQRAKTGKLFNIGVEVCDYRDQGKGFGLRACRTFEPGQIVLEYTGEIITEEKSEERVKNVYKDAKSYYLMSFHKGFIIDATRGSIARFVNHSCEPNCRIEKWVVAGKPRMALFVGDQGVCTGEELSYDYNFEAFSVEKELACMCGSEKCRGTLGPKNKARKGSAEAPAAGGRAEAKGVVRTVRGRRGGMGRSIRVVGVEEESDA